MICSNRPIQFVIASCSFFSSHFENIVLVDLPNIQPETLRTFVEVMSFSPGLFIWIGSGHGPKTRIYGTNSTQQSSQFWKSGATIRRTMSHEHVQNRTDVSFLLEIVGERHRHPLATCSVDCFQRRTSIEIYTTTSEPFCACDLQLILAVHSDVCCLPGAWTGTATFSVYSCIERRSTELSTCRRTIL